MITIESGQSWMAKVKATGKTITVTRRGRKFYDDGGRLVLLADVKLLTPAEKEFEELKARALEPFRPTLTTEKLLEFEAKVREESIRAYHALAYRNTGGGRPSEMERASRSYETRFRFNENY